MANIINGTDTGIGGLITTGDVSDELQLQTAETTAVTINSSQNVGIGTSSPGAKLDILSGSDNANTLLLSDLDIDATNKDGFVTTRHYTNSEEPLATIQGRSTSSENEILIGGTHLTTTYNAATQIKFFTAANNTTTNGTERMRIDSSGNVGIGTDSPIGNLHVSSSGTPTVYIKTSADSSQDATLIIGGARTGSSTSDIAAIRFLNYSNQSTSGAYELARIVARDQSGDYTQQNGDLRFFTSNGGTLNQQLRVGAGGDFSFNSGYGSAAIGYGCRAWAYVDGDGSPVSFLGDGNFSSVTSTTGVYTFSFSTAMPDTNYAVIATVGGSSTIFKSRLRSAGYATTGFVVEVEDDTDTLADSPQVFVAVFR